MNGAPIKFWTLCPEVIIGRPALLRCWPSVFSYQGRDFMQAQVKYEREVKQSILGDRVITIENLTPILTPAGTAETRA